MKCNNCGNELVGVSDEEFKKFSIEFLKTFSTTGILRGTKRVIKFWQGHYSKNLTRVEGYYYCNTCRTYKLVCPNCQHFIELGRTHPFQGDEYKCPICDKSLIYYDERDDDYPYDIPIDYYP